MDILTKENFWDNMEQKYPRAFDYFMEWIDKYKVENDWKDLFNDGAKIGEFPTIKVWAPNYHELPIAMQFGIFNEWSYTQDSGITFPIVSKQPKSFKDMIKLGIEARLIAMEDKL